MKLSRTLQMTIAVAACTAAAAQAATAGGETRNLARSAPSAKPFQMVGEPKNEPPFTNPVATTRHTTIVTVPASLAQFRMIGEPKNEPPFTNPASNARLRETNAVTSAALTTARALIAGVANPRIVH